MLNIVLVLRDNLAHHQVDQTSNYCNVSPISGFIRRMKFDLLNDVLDCPIKQYYIESYSVDC